MNKIFRYVIIFFTFFFFSLVATLYFYNLDASRLKFNINNCKRYFSITANLTAKMISVNFFRCNNIYDAALNNDQKQITQTFDEIYKSNEYVETIQIINSSSLFIKDFYSFESNTDKLFINMKIFDGHAKTLIRNRYWPYSQINTRTLNNGNFKHLER